MTAVNQVGLGDWKRVAQISRFVLLSPILAQGLMSEMIEEASLAMSFAWVTCVSSPRKIYNYSDVSGSILPTNHLDTEYTRCMAYRPLSWIMSVQVVCRRRLDLQNILVGFGDSDYVQAAMVAFPRSISQPKILR